MAEEQKHEESANEELYEWIDGVICSNCKKRSPYIAIQTGAIGNPAPIIFDIDEQPYCPNCGKKMKVSKKNESI